MKKISIFILCIMFVLSACGNKETIQENVNGTNDKKPADITDKIENQEDDTKEESKEVETGNLEEEDKSTHDTNEKNESKKDDGASNRKIVKIEIKDESTQHPELKSFMEHLMEVVAEKNTDELLNMMSDNIHFSFGGGSGKEAFMKEWGLDTNPEESDVWKELSDAISFGGTLSDKNLYTAPYIFVNFPEGYDHFQYGAILGENVNLREKPTSNSNSIMQLSFEVVEMPGEYSEQTVVIEGEKYRWVKIRTLDGEVGYVVEKYVRNPVDYRVGVEQQEDGTWKIVFFIAGD
jgi:hypothetical protein